MIDQKNETNEEKPPFLGSWNKIYLIVFSELIVLIFLFYLFTRTFS
jgi:hypothetical protein